MQGRPDEVGLHADELSSRIRSVRSSIGRRRTRDLPMPDDAGTTMSIRSFNPEFAGSILTRVIRPH
jgi:hypothetical protein